MWEDQKGSHKDASPYCTLTRVVSSITHLFEMGDQLWNVSIEIAKKDRLAVVYTRQIICNLMNSTECL